MNNYHKVSELKKCKSAKQDCPEILTELVLSVRKYGILNPITIDKNNFVVDGNHRVSAAKLLKIEEILVQVI